MNKVGVLTVISLLLISLIATLPGYALVLNDPLTSSDPDSSNPPRFISQGGLFTSEGWKVTGQLDHIIWHMPHAVQKGKVEFDIKGINPNECRDNMDDKTDLFHMYDWTYKDNPPNGGDADHDYNSYRNGPYKHFIRKIGCTGGSTNAFELLLKIVSPYEEPDTSTLIWYSGTTYHMMETWETIGGNCVWKVYRDGALLKTITVAGTWNPAGHSVRIGDVHHDYSAPIDAVYSNIKLTDMSVVVPDPPVISEPTNGATINKDIAFIKWTGDAHTKYQVRISTANSPDSGVVWDSGEVNSEYDFTWTGKLANLTNYYVFAKIGNDAGWSGWSASGRWFRVDTAVPSSGPDLVKLNGNTLVDNSGPILGLGVTYMPAMRRCKYDRTRFINELDYLAARGFTYVRILSMVGWYTAWQGKEIAPCSYNNQGGVYVPAWPDYWQQFRDCIDLIYDHGMRAELTIFADAQLMPNKNDRIAHMQTIIDNLVGREHKVMMLEVCNEAWQNGFSGSQGVTDLREFCTYLTSRTTIPVGISAPGDSGSAASIQELYTGSTADITTVHLERTINSVEGGWLPVRDPWRIGSMYPSIPPGSSNEPIGPGSSVNVENNTTRLVSSAAFCWIANLPMYVYHTGAGVGIQDLQFSNMAAVGDFVHLKDLLPIDVSSWVRNDGLTSSAPFKAFCNNVANSYWTNKNIGTDGCHRNIGAIKGNEFVCLPMGIRGDGVKLEANKTMTFKVYNMITGAVVPGTPAYLYEGESFILSPADSLAADNSSTKDFGAYIIKGEFTSLPPAKTLNVKLGGSITVDGNSSDWNLGQFTTLVRGGQAGAGDIALVGFDGGNCYYGGKAGGTVLPTSAADHTAKVYSRHDATYQYFLVRCDDNDIRYTYPVSDNWQNDCIEFYIDPANDGGAVTLSNSASDIQLVIDANNQKNVFMCTSGYAAQVLAGVTSAVVRDASGWWLEVRIAKSAVDPDLPAAGTFKVDFSFRDNDNNNDAALTTIYTWSDNTPNGGFPSKIPNMWGSAFLNGTNLAQYISDTIPATLDAGKQYNVSVTMKNVGTNTWTSAKEYSLGAINDSDPFAGGRQNLSGSDSIAPNAQKTFSFVMTAPASTGTYTSDWRMVQEAVEWFGDSLVKQVSVINTLPPGPVTNFVATPGDGRNTLSWVNPTDSDFTGTMIRYNTTGYPTSITDGMLVVDKAGSPSASSSHIHTGLTNGTTYYYTAFAHDAVPNNATGVNVSGVPTDACFVETFPYANSNLNGNGGWSGSAGGEIVVSSQAVKYNGGNEGNLDAIRSVTTCGSVTGSVGVSAKIRAGYGTGVMWSMFIDDTSGNNLARCYGSATSVRGRISGGGTVTPSEVPLTGNWDDLYVKINFAGNTSSFYLNGALLGTLSHAETGAGDSIGRIRLMRDSNLTTAGYYMFLDNISIGPADTTAPAPFISAPWVPTIKTGQVKYTVTFSEPVIGFAAADIQVNKTGAVSSGSASVSGTNPYTVTIGSVSGNGTISISVKSAAVVDAAGNTNALTAAATKCVVISADGSVATAKTAAENATVTIGNKILYYKNGTVGYVEEADRFTGLRIEGSIPSLLDDKVSLSGQIKTNASGERYVLLEQVATVGTGTVGALGTNNRGAKLAVMDGLLTTVWGTVKPGSITSNSFIISDGSDEEGIKIITIGAPGVTAGSYVTVTGAAGKEAGMRVIFKN